MRELIKDKNRLQHIIEAIDTILQRTEGLSYEDFSSDKMLFGGIVYYTLIIGEAAYKLTKPFIESNPQINWQEIADMRHHLVHGYYQVDSITPIGSSGSKQRISIVVDNDNKVTVRYNRVFYEI